MSKIVRLTESDIQRLVKQVMKEENESSETIPAKQFIEQLYNGASKYGKLIDTITMGYDGKYITAQYGSGKKVRITIS